MVKPQIEIPGVSQEEIISFVQNYNISLAMAWRWYEFLEQEVTASNWKYVLYSYAVEQKGKALLKLCNGDYLKSLEALERFSLEERMTNDGPDYIQHEFAGPVRDWLYFDFRRKFYLKPLEIPLAKEEK